MDTIIGRDIAQAAALLNDGQIVAVPTETVYGLAANALSAEAVVKIFEAKQRPFFDPLIVHISHQSHIYKYVKMLPEALEKLGNVLWPGPLTILAPKQDCIPDLVTSGLDTVGIRVPMHPVFRQLLGSIDFPLAAPSANPFGYISPTNAQHVYNQLQGRVPYILDGGNSLVGVESTIIGWENEKVTIYRLGGIAVETIARLAGKIDIRIHSSNPRTPGQLDSHYAPRKPFLAGDIYALIEKYKSRKLGIITFREKITSGNFSLCWQLSPEGDIAEAAQNLFSVMREADTSHAEIIIAEYLPETGLGLAVNDRIMRASIQT